MSPSRSAGSPPDDDCDRDPPSGADERRALGAAGRQRSFDDVPGLVMRVHLGAPPAAGGDARPGGTAVALVGPQMPGVAANASAMETLVLPALLGGLAAKTGPHEPPAASRIAPGHSALL